MGLIRDYLDQVYRGDRAFQEDVEMSVDWTKPIQAGSENTPLVLAVTFDPPLLGGYTRGLVYGLDRVFVLAKENGETGRSYVICNRAPEPVTVEIGERWVNVYRAVNENGTDGKVYSSRAQAVEASSACNYIGPARLPSTLTISKEQA